MSPPASALADLPARERLLAVADELFYAEGIRAVGIDRLLVEAGVAKASLYQHFASKDELVAAYLQRRIDVNQAYLDHKLAEVEGGPTDRIVAFFEILGRWMTGPGFRGCPFINAAAEFPQATHPAHRAVKDHRARNRARLLELAAARPGDDPETLVTTLMMLYDGALVAADLDSADAASHALAFAVRHLLGADVKPGASTPRRRTTRPT